MADDLTSRISEILGDPASMEKIRNLAAMLGSTGQDGNKQAPPARQNTAPPQGTPQPRQNQQPNSGTPPIDPALMRSMMKMAPILSGMRQDDDSTRLLRALRPFLGEKRRKKLDEALKLIQLLRIVPYLKGSGLFQS
jgi:hypothetical protein